MALYAKKLIVPANTIEDNPVSTDFIIKEELITKMEVVFPPGCYHLVGIKIFYGIKRLWPEDIETYLYGDNEVISWQEFQRLPSTYSLLTVYGISPDTHYDHAILIRMFTLPEIVAAPGTIFEKLLEFFKRIF